MNLTEKIEELLTKYGVKKCKIYESMYISEKTFKRRMRDNKWKEANVVLFDIKWGGLFNSEK